MTAISKDHNSPRRRRVRAPASPVTGAGGTWVEQGSAFLALEAERIGGQKPAGSAIAHRPRGKAREHFDVVVVGGGQAGLSVGYHLARHGLDFVILEAGGRIGDAWRNRWDSLRLFTPARFDGLDGMPFPAAAEEFPTKDEMADYLEAYVSRFSLPVRLNAKVDSLTREGGRFVLSVGNQRFTADQVIVAAASYQEPKIPEFAARVDPAILQLHSGDYRNPSQLRQGAVLLVGAGNSGAEIAMDIAARHKVLLSGRDVGHIPFRISGFLGRKLLVTVVLRGVYHHILTAGTPAGRWARSRFLSHSGPLIRQRPRDLEKAGVERVPRVTGVEDGLPRLQDGRVVDVANIIWCTGFHPALSWIKLPVLGEDGRPRHDRGIVADQPGLYFVGLHFLYSLSSTMIHGVGRDARRIADRAAAFTRSNRAA